MNRYLTELVILDAGYGAAALTAALRGCLRTTARFGHAARHTVTVLGASGR